MPNLPCSWQVQRFAPRRACEGNRLAPLLQKLPDIVTAVGVPAGTREQRPVEALAHIVIVQVSIGEIDVKAKFEAIVEKDMANFQYKKLVINNNKIIGAILYGDKRNWKSIQKTIEAEKDIGSSKEQLQNWELEAL